MKSSRLVLINIIVLLLIVAGGAAAVYYYNQSVNYITTDNAMVDGQAVTIASPAAGALSEWRGTVGQKYTAGETIGTVKSSAGTVNITVPATGTVVQQSGVVGSIVGAGTSLAKAYDLDNLWISANIKETKINGVKPNQTVDIYVDAFPGTALTGRVSQIGLATAGTFSLLPASNTTGNYTKVTQVIPVKIEVDGYRGLGLVPGLSAKVRIHK